MALQKQVTVISIVKGGGKTPGYNVTMNLKCWEEGVAKTETPIIDSDYTEYLKNHVEGKTTNDLVTEAAVRMKSQMQATIDKYLGEQNLLNSAMLETARSNIEVALEG